MNDKHSKKIFLKILNENIMSMQPNAVFMHCLPANIDESLKKVFNVASIV